MWHVYILLCSNGDYYKGCTNDLDRRMIQHQSGQVESTKQLQPLKVVTYITDPTQNSERHCEHLRGFVWLCEAISEFKDCFAPPTASAGTRNDVKLLVL